MTQRQINLSTQLKQDFFPWDFPQQEQPLYSPIVPAVNGYSTLNTYGNVPTNMPNSINPEQYNRFLDMEQSKLNSTNTYNNWNLGLGALQAGVGAYLGYKQVGAQEESNAIAKRANEFNMAGARANYANTLEDRARRYSQTYGWDSAQMKSYIDKHSLKA